MRLGDSTIHRQPLRPLPDIFPVTAQVDNITIVLENATQITNDRYYAISHLTVDSQSLPEMRVMEIICVFGVGEPRPENSRRVTITEIYRRGTTVKNNNTNKFHFCKFAV